MSTRTNPFRHSAFPGRKIVVTAFGRFLDARTGREIGVVRGGAYFDITERGSRLNPEISRLVGCEFGPLIARLKGSVRPPRLVRLP